MSSRSLRPLTALLALSAGTAATAQPALQATHFVNSERGRPTAIPGNDFIHSVSRFDDDHALVLTDQRLYYYSDGHSLRRVMITGEQVPGQAPGVVWARPGTNRTANTFPLDGIGAVFNTSVIGPGFGSEPTPVASIGNFSGDFELIAGVVEQSTRTGLAAGFDGSGNLLVGPIGGPSSIAIPAAYLPAGFASRSGPRYDERLSATGAVAITTQGMTAQGSSRTAALIADNASIRTAVIVPGTLHSDRADFELRNMLSIGSRPLPDGSIILNGDERSDLGSRSVIWRVGPAGNTIIAIAGERAPGTQPGVYFASGIGRIGSVAANANGTVLFRAALTGPGLPANAAAYFLYRNGRTTLIARNTEGESIDFPLNVSTLTLTENDHVGFIFQDRVLLYTPEIGTVTVARRNQPFPADLDHASTPWQFNGFFGVITGTVFGSTDEERSPLVSSDGEIFFAYNDDFGSGAMSVRIDSPGCPADFNLDGFTDFFDYDDFIACFEGGRCPEGKSPDFNNDDFDDFFDYSDFVTAFESPC